MISAVGDAPAGGAAVIVRAVVVACVAVYLWQLGLDETGGRAAVYSYGSIPAVLLGDRHLAPELAMVPPAVAVFTSMFLHGGWLHLAGNMLYLWLFGRDVERSMGHARFGVFYLLSGAVAVLAHALTDAASTVPLIGASGAISGVLGAFALYFPRASVFHLLPLGRDAQPWPVPALALLGVWFAAQIASAAVASDGGGIAFAAHAGGFVGGMLLAPLFRRGAPTLPPAGGGPAA